MSGYLDAIAAGDRVGVEGAYLNEIDAIVPGAAQAGLQNKAPYETVLDSVFKFATTIATTNAQRKLLDAQLDRAKQGLPPLDSSQYGLGVNLGLSPDTMKLLGVGALALGAVWYLSRRR